MTAHPRRNPPQQDNKDCNWPMCAQYCVCEDQSPLPKIPDYCEIPHHWHRGKCTCLPPQGGRQ